LYVGVFDNNKDVVNLISAFKKALIIKPDLELTLVGGGGNQENEVIRETLESKAIHYLGVILDKDELKKVYRSNDLFIMTSHSETFGLVYLEALSQGLPIIYSRGIGIDGTFPNMSIGESCDSHSEDEICEAIIKVASNYRNYDLLSVKQMMMFSWNNVALQYKKNFEECVV
jgi:glycosyltransferase involved in cell wall biosynthesis